MSRSHDLFVQAQLHIPGGVNSPVRAFKGVGGDPIFFKRAKGPYVYDADDKQYIDYVASWGPMVVGHAHDDGLVLRHIRILQGHEPRSFRRSICYLRHSGQALF